MVKILHIKSGSGDATDKLHKEVSFQTAVEKLTGRTILFCEKGLPQFPNENENLKGFRDPIAVAAEVDKDEIPKDHKGILSQPGYHLIKDMTPSESLEVFD